MNFEQRRQQKRRNLIYYLEAYCRFTRNLIGHVADLTPEGLLLLGEQALDIGENLILVIFLPDEIEKQKYLTLEVECVRCLKHPGNDYYDLGFKILQKPDYAERLIAGIIAQYGFRD